MELFNVVLWSWFCIIVWFFFKLCESRNIRVVLFVFLDFSLMYVGKIRCIKIFFVLVGLLKFIVFLYNFFREYCFFIICIRCEVSLIIVFVKYWGGDSIGVKGRLVVMDIVVVVCFWRMRLVYILIRVWKRICDMW